MRSLLRILVAVSTIAAAAGCQGKQSETSGDSGSEKASQGTAAKGSGANASEHKGPSAGESWTGRGLRADDDGRDLDLRVGQVVTVVLDSNHSNGLSWLMVDPPGTTVVLMGKPLYAPGKGMSGGTETWRFRAARVGRQTVRLEYGRPQGRNVPEKTFRFNVTVR